MSVARSTGRPRRFLDVLNWDTLAAPGVIGCKDGSFIAGWDVIGIDTETMDERELEAWLDQLADGIGALGDGEALRVVRKRRPWRHRPSGWPSASTGGALQALFIEQDAICATPGYFWEDRITLYYHWQRPASAPPRSDDAENGPAPAVLVFFETACRGLEDRLGAVLRLTRLGPVAQAAPVARGAPGARDAPEVTGWYSCALTSSLLGMLGLPEPPLRIRPDDLPIPLDSLISPGVEQRDRGRPGRIECRPAALLALEGQRLAAALQTGRLARIQSQALELTWVSQYSALSPETARRDARKKQKYWRQSGADLTANVIGESEGRRGRFEDRMAEGIEDTIERISSGGTGYGLWATQMLIVGAEGAGDASLDQPVRALTSAAIAAGLSLRREDINFIPGLISMLPGHEGRNARAFMIRADAFVGLLPLRSIWPGALTCPAPLLPPGTPALLRAQAETGEMFSFNLHSGDLGHSLIFGPTGAGKSVLLGLLAAAWLRYPAAQVIYFDRQRSIRHACAALGGTFLEPGSDGPAGIAPLAHLKELGQSWAVDWLTTLVCLQKVEPDTRMLSELRKAVADCARHSATPDFSTVLSFVQIDALREAISPFLPGGALAHLFSEDHLFAVETEPAAQSVPEPSFTAVETHALMEGEEIARVLSLDYIFAQIQRRFDGRPTLVVFDEAWSFFRHPLFAARIRSWLKEGRKNNVSVIMATQSLTDAIRSDLTEELLESCPTKIFLPNAGAETAVIAHQYTALGLTAPEIAWIARMHPKRDYFLTQPEGRRVISFPLARVGLSILGRTSADDSRRAASAGTNPDFWKKDIENACRTMDQSEDPDGPGFRAAAE